VRQAVKKLFERDWVTHVASPPQAGPPSPVVTLFITPLFFG
jgi:hypothetical protein